MTARGRGVLSVALGIASVCLTQAVWWFILHAPPGSFHDQGGMAITFFCSRSRRSGGWRAGCRPSSWGPGALATAGGDTPARLLGLLGMGIAVVAGFLSLGNAPPSLSRRPARAVAEHAQRPVDGLRVGEVDRREQHQEEDGGWEHSRVGVTGHVDCTRPAISPAVTSRRRT